MRTYPIDYCMISLNLMKPFVELHFESLLREMSVGEFKSFHLIDKGSKDETVKFCKKRIPSINVHHVPMYEPTGQNGSVPGSCWQYDQAFNYDYAARRCGDSEWVCIPHADLVYFEAREYFAEIWKLINDRVAAVWDGAFLLMRREAYEQTHLGFWPMLGARIFHYNDRNYLVHMRDNRLPKSEIRKILDIEGVEMWELLMIDFYIMGWDLVRIPFEISRKSEHNSGASGHIWVSSDGRSMWEEKVQFTKDRIKRLKEGKTYR